MPAIEQIRIQETVTGKNHIQELKARAAQALDDALCVVADNLGREEARQAQKTLPELDTALAAENAPSHSLDLGRVMELIADPFEDR